MGQVWSFSGPLARKDIPDPEQPPSFDSTYGFPEERVERVMIATKQQMDDAKLHPELRDYCAHKLLEFQGCKYEKFPFVYKCAGEKHAYLQCQYEDYVLRMKEYERERRLLQRQARKSKKTDTELLE